MSNQVPPRAAPGRAGGPSAASGALFQTGLFRKKKTDGRTDRRAHPIQVTKDREEGETDRPDWISRWVADECLKKYGESEEFTAPTVNR